MTDAERTLWYQCLSLRPERWMRQRPIGHYIVDFYCASSKLVVELDGAQHYTAEGKTRDAVRTAFLESLGLRVIRFENREVRQNLAGVATKIQSHLTPPKPHIP